MAVTFDFGKCAACGESNSKTLAACRACGANLPWSKPEKAAPHDKPHIGLGDIAWGAISVQLLGGALFVGGAVLGVADLLGWVSVFPYLDKIVMAIGGALWGIGLAMD